MGSKFAFVQATVQTNRAAKQLDHSRWFFMSQSSGGAAPQRPGFCHRIPRKAKRGIVRDAQPAMDPCNSSSKNFGRVRPLLALTVGANRSVL
jgi:hypothetical protein